MWFSRHLRFPPTVQEAPACRSLLAWQATAQLVPRVRFPFQSNLWLSALRRAPLSLPVHPASHGSPLRTASQKSE